MMRCAATMLLAALPGLLAAATPATLRAQTPADTTWRGMQDTVTVLPPVTVEGETAVTPARSTATRVHLDRSRLARFLPSSTGDALVSVPGLNLVKTGPWASRVSLRGLAGDRVLVLIDGVRVNTVRGHGGQVSLVPLDRVESVEILPGASSAPFGSDALGGVINLVTHRSLFSGEPRAAASLSLRGAEPGGARVGTGRLRVTGARLGAEITGVLDRLEALVTPERRVPNSGHRDEDLAVRGAAQLGRATFDLEHARHRAFDVGLPAFSDSSGSTAVYPLQARDVDRLEIVAPGARGWPDLRLLAVRQDFRTHFTENTVTDVYVRRRLVGTRTTSAADRVQHRSWAIQPELRFGPSVTGATLPGPLRNLRLGAELRTDESGGPRLTRTTLTNVAGEVTSDSLVPGESVPPAWLTAASAMASIVPLETPVRVEAGVRYDHHRTHADASTDSSTMVSTPELDISLGRWSPEVGLSVPIGGLAPYLRVATGFRAPNLDERFFHSQIHGGLVVFGNPALDPERSTSYEMGVRTHDPRFGFLSEARLSAYRSEVADLITIRYVGAVNLVPRFQYFNVHRSRIEGVELTGRMHFGRVRLDLNFAAPRGFDRETGERLIDAGSPRATLDVVVPFRPLPHGLLATRARWSDAIRGVGATFGRPAFWTGSLELSTVVAGTRAVLSMENIANHAYREPLSFISEPKRTVTLSLRHDLGIALDSIWKRRTP